MSELMIPHGRGRVPFDLAARAQRLADDAGYRSLLCFRGHGVTTTYSDLPAFFPGSTATLEPGMTFAFEPMQVRSGIGTACWKDSCPMTQRGVERLSGADPVWAERSEVAR
jgi:Xaa-Pro aminopeptidase